MLHKLEEVISQEIGVASERGILIEITKSPTDTDNPSITVYFDSKNHIGHLSCWESGEVYQVILDCVSELNILERQVVIDDIDDFRKLLRNFLDVFKD